MATSTGRLQTRSCSSACEDISMTASVAPARTPSAKTWRTSRDSGVVCAEGRTSLPTWYSIVPSRRHRHRLARSLRSAFDQGRRESGVLDRKQIEGFARVGDDGGGSTLEGGIEVAIAVGRFA